MPEFSNEIALLPTRSLLEPPSKLLADETTPTIPAVPLAQVIAPAALFQFGLRIAIVPLVNTCMPPLPIRSPDAEPIRLLADEIAPDTPVV